MQQVERGSIRPVDIVNEYDQRCMFGQDLPQASDSFKQARPGERFINSWWREVGVTVAYLGQQSAEFGEPGVAEQVVWRVFALKARTQCFHHRLVGQTATCLKRLSL